MAEQQCPVMLAWSKDEQLMKRLVGGSVLLVTGDALTRQTVIENRALLDPLIQAVGILTALAVTSILIIHITLDRVRLIYACSGFRPSVDVVAEYLTRFYTGYRPISKPMPPSSVAACTAVI
eukprot:s1872_g3.t1